MGHDELLVRLLAGLRAFSLRWPAFGAGVVFEVRHLYRLRCLKCIYCNLSRCGRLSARFVRVVYEGTVFSRTEWVQMDEFVGRPD